MWRVIFLILVVMCSTGLAQNTENPLSKETSKTKLASEFGKVSNGQIRTLIDNFFAELQNDSSAQGYILNYGTNKDAENREKILRNHIAFRNQDGYRITFVRGKNETKIRTQLWIVPNGAEPPTP